jgi:hypothetical protein
VSAFNPTGHRSRYGLAFWLGLVAGWAIIGYAVTGIWQDREGTNPTGLARWFVGLLAAHDLVVAPLVAIIVGLLAWRLPRRLRGPILGALALSAVLTVFAWPNVRGYGRRPLNSSALPWDYGRNLALVLAGVWVAAGAVILVRAARGRHRRTARGAEPGRGEVTG